MKSDDFLNYLKKNYKIGTPIFAKEVHYGDMTASNIRYHLAHLADKGLIAKSIPGVYYFPKTNSLLGLDVPLLPDDIVYEKYIFKDGNVIGFYTGSTFANRIGLSTQVPYVKEICSNKSPAPKRLIKVGIFKYMLTRPPVPITNDNRDVLRLLDCLKDFEWLADEPIDMCSEALTNYCKICQITKDMVDKYIAYYPQKTYRSIYKSKVEFYVPS